MMKEYIQQFVKPQIQKTDSQAKAKLKFILRTIFDFNFDISAEYLPFILAWGLNYV